MISSVSEKSRTVSAILAFFLGGFGIHNFYLKNYSKAIVEFICTLSLLISIFVRIWTFIEFIFILKGTYKDGDDKTVLLWKTKRHKDKEMP